MIKFTTPCLVICEEFVPIRRERKGSRNMSVGQLTVYSLYVRVLTFDGGFDTIRRYFEYRGCGVAYISTLRMRT